MSANKYELTGCDPSCLRAILPLAIFPSDTSLRYVSTATACDLMSCDAMYSIFVSTQKDEIEPTLGTQLYGAVVAFTPAG